MTTQDASTLMNVSPIATYTRQQAPPDPNHLPIEEFFGPPLNRLSINPYDKTGILAMNLYQAYSGDNLELSSRITNYIADTKNGYLTTLILPLFTIAKLKWIFTTERANPALAGVVPYEGTSRMLTSTIQSFQGQTQRRGIQVKLEGDFYQSPGGKQDFARKIQHIKDTVQRTLDYQVVLEIDQCQDYFMTWIREHNVLKTDPKLLIEWETKYFGCVHRCFDQGAFGTHIQDLEKSLENYGGDRPTVALVPANFTWLFRGYSPVKTQYELMGPDGSVKVVNGPDAIAQLGDVKIIPTQQIRADDDLQPYDPGSHVATVGQFAVMHARQHKGQFQDYTTESQTIFIHSETADDYRPINLVQAYSSCNRWNQETNQLRSEHQTLVSDLNSGGPDSEHWIKMNRSQDPFIRKHPLTGAWSVVELFGEMEPQFLTPTVLENVTDTLKNNLAKCGIATHDADKYLMDLVELCKVSHNEPGTPSYVKKLAEINARYRKATGELGDGTPNNPAALNPYYAFDIPDDSDGPECFAGMGNIPPFVNTYGMLATLAAMKGSRQWGKAAKIAWRACTAVSVMQTVISSCLPGSLLCKLENLPTWQQEMLANASSGEVCKWSLFNVICGVAYPAFMKLLTRETGSVAPAAGASAQQMHMAYNVAAYKMATLTDLVLATEAPYSLGSPVMPGVLRAVVEIPKGRPLANMMTDAAVGFLAAIPGFVSDVKACAVSQVTAFMREQNAAPDLVIDTRVARFVTRLFLDDLIHMLGQIADKDADDNFDNLYERASGLAGGKKALSKYHKCGLIVDKNEGSGEQAAAMLKNEITKLCKLVFDAIRETVAVKADNEPYDMLEKISRIAADMAQSLSEEGMANMLETIRGAIQAADPRDPQNVVDVMSNFVDRLEVMKSVITGLGTGSWERMGEEVGAPEANKYVTKELVSVAKAVVAALGQTGKTIGDVRLASMINYTGTTGTIPYALANSTDAVRRGLGIELAPLTVAEGAVHSIVYVHDFTEKMRGVIHRLAQEGLLTESTTVGEMYRIAGGVMDTAAYMDLPIYRAGFGCNLALAHKVISEPTYYGQMPLIFAPDVGSDNRLPAPPAFGSDPDMTGQARKTLPGEIRAILNRTASAATVSMTGAYALFKPTGREPSRVVGADVPGMHSYGTMIAMHTLHNNTFARSEVNRSMAMAFAVTPIGSWETVLAMLQHDILLPFSALVARLWITMITHDITLMRAGKDTGMTFIGMDNCSTGKDVGVGVWIVNYHFHARPFIYRPENVIKMRDAAITKVLCGFDTEPILSDADTPVSGNVQSQKSIIYMLGGFYDARLDRPADPYATARGLSNPVSVTGDYAQLPIEGRLDEYEGRVFGPASYYMRVFPETFSKSKIDIATNNRATMAGYKANTLCWLGEHYYQDPATGQWTGHVNNSGHFSVTATMPGSALVRKGAAATYAQTFAPATGLVP